MKASFGVAYVLPAHEMIDPLKDTVALVAQVRDGFVPQPEAVGAFGYDFRQAVQMIREANDALDDAGISLDTDERDRLAHDLGPQKAMILRNHGLLVGGTSITDAWHGVFCLKRACQTQVRAQSGGAALYLPPPDICEHTAAQFDRVPEAKMQFLWQSCLRLLDGDWRC